jgi:cytoskeletal protein CcmA (bactofilin family)
MFGKNSGSGRLFSAPATTRPQPAPVLGKKGMQPSVIAADLNVLGNIISDGVLDIDGKIDGNVRCHTASIRPNGRVHGDVTAEIVHVYGAVEGVIKAKSVMLYATAKVVGTIMHESLSIEDGAFVDGKFKRTDKVFIDDEPQAQLTGPIIEASVFENDNDEPVTEAEVKILENLRLVR